MVIPQENHVNALDIGESSSGNRFIDYSVLEGYELRNDVEFLFKKLEEQDISGVFDNMMRDS